jgi:hypothetical protein
MEFARPVAVLEHDGRTWEKCDQQFFVKSPYRVRGSSPLRDAIRINLTHVLLSPPAGLFLY